MFSQLCVIFLYYEFFTKIDAQQVQTLSLSLFMQSKYQCISPGCSPSQILASPSLRSCQMSCLINIECRTITFSESINLCEIFIDTPSQYGIITSDSDSVTMIAIDDRLLSARTTPTTTSTSTTSTVTTTTAPVWVTRTSMNVARRSHIATTLSNGKILVTGGFNTASLNSAELYDPSTNTWTLVAPMSTTRMNHVAAEISNGVVLVAGGSLNSTVSSVINSAEIYYSANNTWIVAANMTIQRSSHTITTLSDGTVLVVGGSHPTSLCTNTAEIYNMTSNSWRRVANMTFARSGHQATLLSDGRILVVSGISCIISVGTAEIYNPLTNTWLLTSNMTAGRTGHTSTLLLDGRVLVAGGGAVSISAFLYNPSSNNWTNGATGMLYPRQNHRATRLFDGQVLVTGGSSGSSTISAELFNPITNSWMSVSNMTSSRGYHTSSLLSDGKVFVTGGQSGSTAMNTVEVL